MRGRGDRGGGAQTLQVFPQPRPRAPRPHPNMPAKPPASLLRDPCMAGPRLAMRNAVLTHAARSARSLGSPTRPGPRHLPPRAPHARCPAPVRPSVCSSLFYTYHSHLLLFSLSLFLLLWSRFSLILH